jgi:hypothetical protein
LGVGGIHGLARAGGGVADIGDDVGELLGGMLVDCRRVLPLSRIGHRRNLSQVHFAQFRRGLGEVVELDGLIVLGARHGRKGVIGLQLDVLHILRGGGMNGHHNGRRGKAPDASQVRPNRRTTPLQQMAARTAVGGSKEERLTAVDLLRNSGLSQHQHDPKHVRTFLSVSVIIPPDSAGPGPLFHTRHEVSLRLE